MRLASIAFIFLASLPRAAGLVNTGHRTLIAPEDATVLERAVQAAQRAVLDGGSKPHIIFILCDDLGWAGVGHHNDELKTPHINELFKNGVAHDAHYSGRVCAPTRASFLTGRLPYKTRASINNFQVNELDGTEMDYNMLPAALSDVGYKTHLVGKWHQGYYRAEYLPTNRGFHSFYGFLGGSEDHMNNKIDHDGCEAKDLYEDDMPAVDVTDKHTGTSFTKRAVSLIWAHDRSKPMFLLLALHDPHGPVQAPPEYIARYNFNVNKSTYYGMHSVIDDCVGNVTKALKDKGMYDNSLIVFTSDNGAPVSFEKLESHGEVTNYPLRGGKGTVWEGGVKVPTAISGGLIPKVQHGQVRHNLMSIADWYATLGHLAGLPVGEGKDGRESINQWNYLTGADASGPRQELVLNRKLDNRERAYTKYQGAMRVGRWKLIVGQQFGSIWNIQDFYADAHPSECITRPCLFDIFEDHQEMNDLSQSNKEVLDMMMQKWDDLGEEELLADAPVVDRQSICAHFSNTGFVSPWERKDPELVVWVHGFGRSSSSTILSMVRAYDESAPAMEELLIGRGEHLDITMEDMRHQHHVFTMFEPCHSGDHPQVKSSDECTERLLQLARCDFSSVSVFGEWENMHTSSHELPYSPETASVLCSSSDVVAFKTINTWFAGLPKLEQHIPLLEREPRLRILHVIRDPRGIYGSYKTQAWGELSLEDICDCMAHNLEIHHDRVHKVVFEQLVRDPHQVMENAYLFLGLPFGSSQKAWIKQNFDASDCGDVTRYDDCHEDSQAVPEKWRDILSDDDKAFFARHKSCQTVREAYEYPE